MHDSLDTAMPARAVRHAWSLLLGMALGFLAAALISFLLGGLLGFVYLALGGVFTFGTLAVALMGSAMEHADVAQQESV